MRTGKVTPAMKASAIAAAFRRRGRKVVRLPQNRSRFVTHGARSTDG